jgi:DNA invertase Pin-like site-specific DNA recombinase
VDAEHRRGLEEGVKDRPCDLLNMLAAIADKAAGFRSLADTWADTTTPHGRLILTVLGGLAEQRSPD